MLFGFHKEVPHVAPASTLTRVRQIMGHILRRAVDDIHPTDSFASLTGASTVNPDNCELDDDLLDLCALEVAIKEEFNLEVSEEVNEQLFCPGTTALMFAEYIDRHRSHT